MYNHNKTLLPEITDFYSEFKAGEYTFAATSPRFPEIAKWF